MLTTESRSHRNCIVDQMIYRKVAYLSAIQATTVLWLNIGDECGIVFS